MLIVWGTLVAVLVGFLGIGGSRLPAWVFAFFTGIFLNLGLYTNAGDIHWLWPQYAQGFHLVEVPASRPIRGQSVLANWTFRVERDFCLTAFVFAVYRRNSDS